MAFAHLHLHTEYSLLDGMNRIGPLLDRVKELGMDACAITDHGAMYGVIDFYNEALKRGIHPVIGCEVYTCEDMDDHSPASRLGNFNHLILLCETQEGYENLIHLVSESWTRGFYYRPRADIALLKKYHKGLIASSACLSGKLSRLILDGRYSDACAHALEMEAIFGKGNYFIEIQDHGLEEQRQVLPQLVRLSEETGIPLIATNDCHYLTREDAFSQEVLMCIQTGKTLADEKRMRSETKELYVKSEDEMRTLFSGYPEAVSRTEEIAKRCRVQFTFGETKLPRFPTENGETSEQMLRRLCEQGLSERYKPVTPEARKRLEYELSVITGMGYVDYFLIVWDFINYARSQGIVVGPGRGSGAGSIVAYSLYITQLDPLRYSLLFERFLNPERVSMPDIDVDFCYERRQEVIDYVARRYGPDHVSQIITFGTMAARAVVRDVGRVLGYPYAEVDTVSKLIPYEPAAGITLAKALDMSPELKERYNSDDRVHRLIDISRNLEGLPRHASTHAAGVLITDKPVTDYVPLQRNDEVITTQFPMGTIERLGLLKMDFLGLRTLTVIRDALALMAESGVSITAEDIPMDDPAVYDMISKGETDGVFQLESGGMRSFLTGMKPRCFEDIIAAISLYRPGPMDSIPRYIEGKNHPEKTVYLHPKLEPILKVTYGCMVYQEQVMQIVRDLAGYSYGRSDLVRRAMSKKKHDVMAKEREVFIHGSEENGEIVVPGCVRMGVSEEIANQLFDEMTAFASYAFNKSHAAAYAVVAVRTAWLKAHYPVQFFAAMLNSVADNSDKVAGYAEYCRRHGIPLLPPDINRSVTRFSVDRDTSGKPGIRFGLAAIRSCGDRAIDAIIETRRKGGPFRDFFEFARRIESDLVNKRAVEAMILAGAFDCTGANRAQLLAVCETVLDSAARSRRGSISGQMSLFGDGALEDPTPQLPKLPDFPLRTRLAREKEVTGLYITGHPLSEYSAALRALSVNTSVIADALEGPDHGQMLSAGKIVMGGILTETRQKATRAGAMMGFATLEDLTGSIECIIFPKAYDRVVHMLQPDSAVTVTGRLAIREDEPPKLHVDSIAPLITDEEAVALHKTGVIAEPAVAETLPGRILYLLLPVGMPYDAVAPILKTSPGSLPVTLCSGSRKNAVSVPPSLRVRPTQPLLDALIGMLGKDSVVLK